MSGCVAMEPDAALISHIASSAHSNIDVLVKLVQSQQAELLELRRQVQQLQQQCQLQRQQPALETVAVVRSASSSSSAAIAAAAPSSPPALLSQQSQPPLPASLTVVAAVRAASSSSAGDNGSNTGSSSSTSQVAVAARPNRKRGREEVKEERKEATAALTSADSEEGLEILGDASRRERSAAAMRREAQAIPLRVAMQEHSGRESQPLPLSEELERLEEEQKLQRGRPPATRLTLPTLRPRPYAAFPPASQRYFASPRITDPDSLFYDSPVPRSSLRRFSAFPRATQPLPLSELEEEQGPQGSASATSSSTLFAAPPPLSASRSAPLPTTLTGSRFLCEMVASGTGLPPASAPPAVPAAALSSAGAVPKAAQDLDRLFDELEEEHDRYSALSKQLTADQQAQQAYSLAEQRDYAAALPLFSSAIALIPPQLLSPRLVRGRLTCCARLHDNEAAMTEARLLYSRWPSSLSAFLLGTVMARARSFEKAVSWLKEAERRKREEGDSEAQRCGPENKQQEEEKEGKGGTGAEPAVHGETDAVSLQQIEDSIRMVEAKRQQQARRQQRRQRQQAAGGGGDDENQTPALEDAAVAPGSKHVTFTFASSQSSAEQRQPTTS